MAYPPNILLHAVIGFFKSLKKKPAPTPEPSKDVSYECIVSQILADLHPDNHTKWSEEKTHLVEHKVTFCDGDRIYGLEVFKSYPIESWLTNTDVFQFTCNDAKRIRLAVVDMIACKSKIHNAHKLKADQRILAKIFPNCVKK